MERNVELAVLIERMRANRRVVTWIVLTCTLVVGVVAYLLPPWYRAKASLMPPSEEESDFGLSSMLKGFGVPGAKVPIQAAPVDVFVAVLESDRINREIVRRFQLQKLYRKRYMSDAIMELRSHVKVRITEAGTVDIEVEDRNPNRAAQMANAYVDLLDRFNRNSRMTRGRRTRLFVEQRVAETKDSLAQAEQRLSDYERKNKAVALSPVMSSALDAAARHYAERAALHVRLGVVRSYTRGRTDEERQIMQQLAELDRQLGLLPATGLELTRLIRDVKTFEQLHLLLTGQYEEARIMEARDTPTIDQLDVATPPERRSRPRRVLIVTAAFFMSLAAAGWYALARGQGALVGDGSVSNRG